MSSEQKACAKCNVAFTLEPDDFAFFEKMGVKPPTWCAPCQLQKRMSFRNERMLYKRKCQVPGHEEEMISNYAPEAGGVVYDQKAWWGDSWDALDYGRDYDFNKPFFEQVHELIKVVPWPALYNMNSVNSDYCNMTTDNKNCYLVFGGDFNENCSYSTFNFHSRDSMDLYFSNKCELCYWVIDSDACYRVFFGRYLKDCSDSAFLYNCLNCQNCFGCVNLKNRSYCMWNEQLTKEEYEKRLAAMNLGSYRGLRAVKEKFAATKKQYPHRFAEILRSVESTGDNIFNAKNCKECFEITGPAEDLKHVFLGGWGLKDTRNSNHVGHQIELVFDSCATFSTSQRITYSALIGTSHDIQYSYNCRASNNLFGCVGMNNKSYCVLNKQYSKEEYLALVPEILEHMDAMPYKDAVGREYCSGESLPAALSPFGYNETIANEQFPLTKEEAVSQGYTWRESDKKANVATVNNNDIPDDIKSVSDDITKEVFACEHGGTCNENCTAAFRIIPEELQFYKRMNLPLPRLCPSCRHYTRLAERNSMKLYSRACECAGLQADSKGAPRPYRNLAPHFHGETHCPNEFQSSYAPDREEIIYCEQCNQQETE